MLAERDLVIDNDLPTEIRRTLKINSGAYDQAQEELSKLRPVKDSDRIEQLFSRLRELSAEREQLIDGVRMASPRFAALRYPQPLDVSATRKILDIGTILLSFSVCRDRTVLFLVQPTGAESGLTIFTLPVAEETLRKQVEEFRKLIIERRTANDEVLVAHARQLYDELLRPAESLVATSKRVLLVPDGPLYSLPFQALMRNANEYLIEWKPMTTVASATVYAALRKAHRGESKPVELVAFGDPHYPEPSREHSQHIGDLEVQAALQRGLTLGPLPFSRMEVQNISALYPSQSQKYLGTRATEERAKSLGKDVRYIHFAVHALLDERFPLNSALALTIPDRAIKGRDNGLLQAWEIFEEMRLDADLVTLSACNTGRGKELSGEGLLGLTSAFQYAGARAILASLWSVDDFQTMHLMTEFYRELHADNTKDQALQAAQLILLRSKNASAPYYWAGFTLTGDWR